MSPHIKQIQKKTIPFVIDKKTNIASTKQYTNSCGCLRKTILEKYHSLGLLTVFLLTAMSFTLLSCNKIHQFPNIVTSDTSDTIAHTLNIELTIDAKNIIEQAIDKSENGSLSLRAIIEIYSHGNPQTCILRKEILTGETDPNAIKVQTSLNLQPGKYHLLAWVDYVESDKGNDLYYATTPLRTVKQLDPMTANNDYLDCFSLNADFIVEPVEDATYPFTLHRAVAKFTIVTPITKELLAKLNLSESEILEQYKVRFIYKGYIINGFDVYADEPNASNQGYYYDCDIKKTADNEFILGFDYQFLTGNESKIPISLHLIDNKGNIVNLFDEITIPLLRGDNTVIRVNFQTGNYTPGVSIDQDFNQNKIEITIPD